MIAVRRGDSGDGVARRQGWRWSGLAARAWGSFIQRSRAGGLEVEDDVAGGSAVALEARGWCV